MAACDVGDFAVQSLVGGDDSEQAPLLAWGSALDENTVAQSLSDWANSACRLAEPVRDSLAFAVFVYGYLQTIQRETSDDERRLDLLEWTYAHFGYPEVLDRCSRYYTRNDESGRPPDPFMAMSIAKQQLLQEMAELWDCHAK